MRRPISPIGSSSRSSGCTAEQTGQGRPAGADGITSARRTQTTRFPRTHGAEIDAP